MLGMLPVLSLNVRRTPDGPKCPVRYKAKVFFVPELKMPTAYGCRPFSKNYFGEYNLLWRLLNGMYKINTKMEEVEIRVAYLAF